MSTQSRVENKKVLVISNYFLDQSEVGSHRPRSFVDSLLESGYKVDVICDKRDYDSSLSVAFGDDIKVHAVGEWPDPIDGIWMLLKKLSNHQGSGISNSALTPSGAKKDQPEALAGDSEAQTTKPSLAYRLRRAILSYQSMYSSKKSWMFNCMMLLLWHKLTGKHYDVVISSSPATAVNPVARMAKKLFNARWVMDLRDPLFESESCPPVKSSPFRIKMEEKNNFKSLTAATYITVTTPSYLAKLKQQLADIKQNSNKAALIYNGYKSSFAEGESPKCEKFRVIYAGIFYNWRSPFEFLIAAKQLIETGKIDAQDLQIDFYGDCLDYDGQDMPEWVAQQGLGDQVNFLGSVKRSTLHLEYLNASLLLILAQNQPIQIPGKTFEYMAYHSDILAITEPESDTAKVLSQHGIGQVVDSNAQQIAPVLLEMYQSYRRGEPLSLEPRMAFLRSAQNAKLVDLLEQENCEQVGYSRAES